MRRKESKRYLNLIGHAALSATLAMSVACSTATTPKAKGAQTRDARVAAQVDEHLARARAELKAENYERAMMAVDQAYELDRNNRDTIKLRQTIKSDQEEAKAKAVEDWADDQVDKAYALYKSKKYDDAAAIYKEVLAKDAGNKSAKSGLTKIDKAKQAAMDDRLESIYDQVRQQLKSNNIDAAEDQLRQARELDPKSKYVSKMSAAIAKSRQEIDKNKAEAERRAKELEAKRLAEAKKAESAKKAEEAKQKAEEAKAKVEAAKKAEEAKSAEAKAKAEAAKKAEEAKAKAAEAKAVEVAKAEEKPVVNKMVEAETKKTEEAATAKAVATDAAKEMESKKAEETKKAEEATSTAESKVKERRYESGLKEAKALADAGKLDEAVESYDKLLAVNPEKSSEIKKLRDRVATERDRVKSEKTEAASKEKAKAAEAAFAEGLQIYEKDPTKLDNLEAARAKWNETLAIDPGFERARVYLQDTEKEYLDSVAERRKEREFAEKEKAALAKMDTPIPINTLQPTPLPEFLRTLKLLSGIDFVLSGGVDARIEAAFSDKPLHEVLDSVLLPIGLKWERKTGEDVVVITPDLRTNVFRVTPEQIKTIDSLLDRGTLQTLMYGPSAKPVMDGQEIYTDPRQNIVVMTDSEQNIAKFGNLIKELRNQDPVGLVFQSYVIQEDKAPQIKALLEAILRIDDEAPYNPERKLIIEGGELIIKDTPENIRRVEEILKDRKFLSQIYDKTLGVETFNLTPILEIQDNPDLARQFGENVRQVIETLLYAQEGKSKANAEGRRLWYDEATLQLTITDYPDRLNAVSKYIESLPQIRRERKTKIVFLNWATASDLASEIDTFIGGGDEEDSGASNGANEILKTLRTDQEFEWRGAFFRVTSVEDNDEDDENDDDVTLIVRSGDQSDEQTIEEFRIVNFSSGEFSVVAEDIKPASTPGEGRAKLRFIYTPENATNNTTTTQQTAAAQATETTAEDTEPLIDVTVEPIENLNALWISYENGADLDEVEFWIRTLDTPTLQVSLEIKFVEVVENKARELKADFSVGDLTEGISLSDSIIQSRFAQDVDEYRSPFEPFVEGAASANLLKGATVTNWIINNGESPISLTLRALEAQGVINVVNAPSITVLNNQSATFSITRQIVRAFNIVGPDHIGSGDGLTGGRSTTGGTTGSTSTTSGIIRDLRLVDNLDVTPSVTHAGNILLSPIEVVIQDYDQNMGAVRALFDPPANTGDPELPAPLTVTNTGNYGILEKDIETSARIRDGGTVVLGGWKNERTDNYDSGVPILRDIPFVGKFLFNRTQETSERVTLLIFLTGSVVRD